MIKVPKKPGTQESYLRIIKYVYNKLIADIMLNGGKNEGVSSKIAIII